MPSARASSWMASCDPPFALAAAPVRGYERNAGRAGGIGKPDGGSRQAGTRHLALGGQVPGGAGRCPQRHGQGDRSQDFCSAHSREPARGIRVGTSPKSVNRRLPRVCPVRSKALTQRCFSFERSGCPRPTKPQPAAQATKSQTATPTESQKIADAATTMTIAESMP